MTPRRSFLKQSAFALSGALWLPAVQAQQIYLPRRRPPTAAASSYTYYSSYFDGTNDHLYITAGLSGEADGAEGLLSAWLKLDGSASDGAAYYITCTNNGAFSVYRTSGNKIGLVGFNPAWSKVFEIRTSSNIWHGTSAVTGWVHLLASWDMSTAGRRHLLINGNSDLAEFTFTAGSTINYDDASAYRVGSADGTTGKWYGYMSEVYLSYATGSYMDLTVAGNVSKFRTSGGKPENLGSDGSTPTGAQPILYLKNEYSTFQNNAGSGGNFTEAGEITDGGADIP